MATDDHRKPKARKGVTKSGATGGSPNEATRGRKKGPSKSANQKRMPPEARADLRHDDALRQNEILSQALSDNLPDGLVYQIDSGPDGQTRRFTYLSAGVEKLHGITPADARADASRIYNQILPEYRNLIAEREAYAAAHMSPFSAEVRVQLPSGEIRWRHFRSAPRRLANGSLIWDGIEIDVTDRRRAEAAMIETGQTLSSLLDNLPGFIYRRDNDPRWTMRYVSPGCKEITGWASDDFTNNRVLAFNDIIDPDHRRRLWERWQDLLANQRMFEGEYPIIDRNGNQRWVWERGRGIFLPDGSLQCIEGLIIDATNKRRAEEGLKASEERFRQMFDAHGSVKYLIDPETGNIVFANRAAAEYYGYPIEELQGMNISRINTLPLPDIAEKMTLALKQEQARFIFRHRLASGSVRDVELYASPVNVQGKTLLYSIIHDITDRNRTEGRIRMQAMVLDQIHDLVTVTDLEGNITYVNEAESRMMGITKEELIGKNVSSYGEDPQGVSQSEIVRRTREEGGWRGNVINFTSDGREVILDCRTQLVTDDAGAPIALCGISTDITEHKRAEEVLRAAEERYRTILLTAQDGFWVVDVQGRILEVNEAYCRMSGYASDEIISRTISDFEAVEDKEATARHLRRVMEEGRDRFESRHRRKDGSIFDVEVNVQYLPIEGGRVIVFIRDVTERKQAEAALRESEERWQFALEGPGDGVWDWDVDTDRVFFSRRLKEMLGYDDSEIGDHLDEWKNRVHPDDLAGALKDLQRHFDGETEIYINEHRLRCKDGSYKWILDRGRVISRTPEGKPLRVIGTHSDISERKRAEEALRESEARVHSKLAALVSPDLDLSELELEDIIDVPAIQELMDKFYELTRVPVAVIDFKGKVLVGTGWQDICTRFHRVHPETLAHCLECDTVLTREVPPGSFKTYICKNGLRDCATPLIVGGKHVGNLFTGQFFFKGDRPDEEFFRAQAARYGFDETAYLEAYRKVPVWDQAVIDVAFEFYARLAGMISSLSHGNLAQARMLEEQKRAEEVTRIQRDLGIALSAPLGLARTLTLSLQAAITISDMDSGGIYLKDPMTAGLNLSSHLGLSEAFVALVGRFEPDDPATIFITGGEPEFVRHPELGINRVEAWTLEGLRAIGVIPIKNEGEVIGCLNVASRRLDEIPVSSRHPLEMIASQMGSVISRTRAEEALRESEERYRTIVENVNDAIYLHDFEGNIIDVNENACRMLGYQREELVGANLSNIGLVEKSSVISGQLVRFMVSDSVLYEGELLRKNGTTFPVEVSAKVVSRKGKGLIQGIVRDISERKQIEEERLRSQRLESIGVLAGGIAHDFNNILTGILGNISLAKIETEAGQNPAESLAAAEQASIRARDLTRQLLTFSRGGQPVVQLSSVREIVEEAVGFVRHGSNVRCDLALAPDLRPSRIDPGQISQVVHNLVINAIQSMPGGGNILISAENADLPAYNTIGLARGPYVVISVADRGPGIPPELLTKIFDPYFTTKEKGSGLGLATCYSIVNRHQGRITVESEVGQGTVFRVYLPASAEELPQETKAAKPLRKGEGLILLMDDEEVVRRVARRMLSRLGYEVEEAGDGAEAVEMYRTAHADGRPYHAVIFDLTVPGGMGGKDAIAEIRKFDPAVKAIVASGYSDDPVMADCRKYGFSGMVAKPFKLDELGTVLQMVIGEK